MSFTTNQLRDFASLFSRSEVNRWLKDDFNTIDLKLSRSDIFEKNQGVSYLVILRKIYRILEKNYPNEYILKNEFLNLWLRDRLGTQNSKIFNELRIGKVIVDLAMFNGNSKAFEIKSILDKEYRLSTQLREYKKIFNEVYIIIPESCLSKYIDYDSNVGVIIYESTAKSFELVKKPIKNCKIDVDVLMEVLHTKEYLEITKQYYKELPAMNSFDQFKVCKQLISEIPYEDINHMFIDVMKKRKINNLFFNKINNEFNQLLLSLNLKQDEKDKLINKLKSNSI